MPRNKLLEQATQHDGHGVGEMRRLENQLQAERMRRQKAEQARQHAENELALALTRDRLWGALEEAAKPPKVIEKPPKTPAKDNVAGLLLSDWHVGQTVSPSKTNGLNEYGPEIAAARATKCIKNWQHLRECYKPLASTPECFVWLGGDLITGYIHEELEESNALSPVEEVMLCVELCSNALHTILKDKSIKHCHVICNRGNHGRTTKKIRISTGYENSYETLLYAFLERETNKWKMGSRLRWTIAEGDQVIVPIAGRPFRMHHGDKIKYQGGVGGLHIPLNKAIHRMNTSRRCDHDIFGHYHQFVRSDAYTGNASLIGMDEYATGIGVEYSEPSQTFLVVDPNRGVVQQARVFVT